MFLILLSNMKQIRFYHYPLYPSAVRRSIVNCILFALDDLFESRYNESHSLNPVSPFKLDFA